MASVEKDGPEKMTAGTVAQKGRPGKGKCWSFAKADENAALMLFCSQGNAYASSWR